jgi:hypothetical protein
MPQTEFFGKTYSVSDDYILVKTIAVREELNRNFDYFPREELEKSWEQYGEVDLVFVDHTYKKSTDSNYYEDGIDRSRTRGFVVASGIKDDESGRACIHLLIAVDKSYSYLVKAIEDGDMGTVSMGCYSDLYCSICGELFSELNPCPHCPALIGTRFNGKLVFDILRNICFYEISLLVQLQASPVAIFYEVIE